MFGKVQIHQVVSTFTNDEFPSSPDGSHQRTQVISHRSVWNLRTLGFWGGIFPEPYPEAWDPEPSRNPGTLKHWMIVRKDPLFHSAFFWSKKNLKILIIHRYQQLTSSQPNTSPNWFPKKHPELWTDTDMWNQPIR